MPAPESIEAVDSPPPSWTICAALAALGIHTWVCTVGWNNDIGDLQSFRQTQTAITAFYYLRDGFSIAYPTPITGQPWLLPFEFPLYQILAAASKMLFGCSLESAGRLVSIFFFYATLLLLHPLMRVLRQPPKAAWVAIAFLAASPVYITWTRAFLIESLSLFLTVAYVLAGLRFCQSGKAPWLAAAVAVGALASMVKLTTFALGLLVLAAFLSAEFQLQRNWKAILSRHGVGALFLLGAPVAAALLWTAYADSLKHDSVLAELFTSKNQRAFVFGQLSERFSIRGWIDLARFGLPYLFGAVKGVQALLIAALSLALIAWSRNRAAWIFLLVYPAAPLIFRGLYAIHTYYWYENGIFLLIALAIVLGSPRAARLKAAITVLLLAQMWFGYFTRDYPVQARPVHLRQLDFFREIREKTPPDSVLIVLGEGCDSTIPYFAERRAIMKPLATTRELFEQALDQNKTQPIAAIILGRSPAPDDPAYAAALAQRFHCTSSSATFENTKLWIAPPTAK